MGRYYCDYCGHEFTEEEESICPYCDFELEDYEPDEYDPSIEDEMNGHEVFGSA
jgi:uncharacterized protein with PIN domain